ncbi:MAG: bifunctional nuclease family protein [Pseudomonadota bacterium]
MVELQVAGLSVDEASKSPILVLRHDQSGQIIPIWIGAMEAMSISYALNGTKPPRPLTHDLLLNTIAAMRGELIRIEINELQEGTFKSELIVAMGTKPIRVDCRPSDAVALALRARVPVMIHQQVLRAALTNTQYILQDGTVRVPPQASPMLQRRILTQEQAEHLDDIELSSLLEALSPETKECM